jgi:hypothetical protein
MTARFGLLAVTLLTLAPMMLQAQSETKSTAQAGQMLPAGFPSYNINGARAQFVNDLIGQHNLSPVVAVICKGVDVKNPGDPLKSLLSKLEAVAAENKAAKFGTFAIFLNLEKKLPLNESGEISVADQKARSTDMEARIADLEGLAETLKLKELVLGLEAPDCKAAGDFAIGKDDQITVLVYNRHKVEARFAFTKDKPLTDADVTKILESAAKLLPPKK